MPAEKLDLTAEQIELEQALEAQYRATEAWKQGAGAEQWDAWRVVRDAGARRVIENGASEGP